MARVEFNSGEIDQIFQVEDGIRRTLKSHPVASVVRSVIESSYDLLDDGGKIIEGDIDKKCQQIATKVRAKYSLKKDEIDFTRISG